jgi:Fic-DOC domain mobile mystery protein B
MGLDFDLVNGQTPLDEEEKDGLLIPTITIREELDEFEQQGIERAIQWTLGKRFKRSEVLTEEFVKILHKKMFVDVWAWAGEFRKTNKNIGVDRYQVAIELRRLLDDCNHWIDHGTYSPDEIAIRFKHRIMQIHCFSNGNGRHSRLMADIIIEKIFNQPVFTWGSHAELTKNGKGREVYLAAIKAADANEIRPLVQFGRE